MLLEDLNPSFFYHGTSTALGIEKIILPPDQTTKLSEVGRKRNLNKVFFTRDPRSAESYAHKAVKNFGGDPVIYKVKPVGQVDVLQATPGTSVFMADAAEILDSDIKKNVVKIHEMTMRMKTMSDDSQAEVGHINKFLDDNGKAVAKIDNKIIKHTSHSGNEYYGICNDDKVTSSVSAKRTTVQGMSCLELFTIYTNPEFRQKNDMLRLFWYLKDNVSNVMVSHGVLYDDGYNFYTKKLAKSDRFDLSWFNIKTGDKLPITDEQDKMSNAKKTDWRILIEKDAHPLDLGLHENMFFHPNRSWQFFEN